MENECAFAPEMLISQLVNHLGNDTEKLNIPGAPCLRSLQGILPSHPEKAKASD